MLAALITKARINNQKIVHKPELKPLAEIALKVVADNYLLYKELKGLDEKHKIKVYELMSVDYQIEDIFPYIDYEPFWKRACEFRFKDLDISNPQAKWKQLYAENHIQNLISHYTTNYTEEDMDYLIRVCQMVKDYIFNLTIPTFCYKFEISFIPQYFTNLNKLYLKYSPILIEHKERGNFYTSGLEPIEDEYLAFGIRVPDLKNFCLLIPNLKNFKSLSLQGNLVDDEMIKCLVPGLISNPILEDLDLSNNHITEQGMIKICSYLIKTTALKSLNLTNNLIGGESSYAIGLVLKENTKLKSLNLSMNRFDDLNGAILMKMLAFNTDLEELNLSSNLLGEETMKHLQASLEVNTTIQVINLSYNEEVRMNDELKELVETHPLLIEFNIHHTKNKTEEEANKLDAVLIKKAIKLKINRTNQLRKAAESNKN